MSKIILKHTTPATAVKQAREMVVQERSGEQFGLYSPFSDLNIAMGKFFRFNNVNLFAGLSGHGKSYLLNIITDAFTQYEKGINENINFIPVILHFCFEMSAHNEILRSVAKDMGVSYGYLLSSQYNKETQDYNRITDEELRRIDSYLDFYSKKNIIFFEASGNMPVIYNTIEYMVEHYTKLAQRTGIPHKFVINIDHTLLIDTLNEKSTLDLMANVGKISINIRKDFLSMVNLVGQLNNNIEDVRRLLNPALQYPQKSDIYAQSQLYNACDSVFVTHQPQLLKLTEYGLNKMPTDNLIHLLKLKSRHGNTGSIWLKNDLNKGNIVQYPKDTKTILEEDKNMNNI